MKSIVPKPNDEKRIKQNAKNGYILVKVLQNGSELYKKSNGVGGWKYYGESCDVFTIVWDDALSTKQEFIAIAKDCYNLEL